MISPGSIWLINNVLQANWHAINNVLLSCLAAHVIHKYMEYLNVAFENDKFYTSWLINWFTITPQIGVVFTGETMCGAPVDLSFKNISSLTGATFFMIFLKIILMMICGWFICPWHFLWKWTMTKIDIQKSLEFIKCICNLQDYVANDQKLPCNLCSQTDGISKRVSPDRALSYNICTK